MIAARRNPDAAQGGANPLISMSLAPDGCHQQSVYSTRGQIRGEVAGDVHD
jgi:hypothetical protein